MHETALTVEVDPMGHWVQVELPSRQGGRAGKAGLGTVLNKVGALIDLDLDLLTGGRVVSRLA